jgi:hypothetical protein
LFGLTTVVLAMYGQTALDLYFSIFLLEYLALTVLFVALDQRSRRLLSVMGYLLFVGFLAVLVSKAVQIVLPTT